MFGEVCAKNDIRTKELKRFHDAVLTKVISARAGLVFLIFNENLIGHYSKMSSKNVAFTTELEVQ